MRGETNKRSKRAVSVILILVLCMTMFCMAGCAKVESVIVSNSDITIAPGNATSVSYTLLPEKAAGKNITWESSNESIATVNQVGVISAVSPGSCVLTLTVDNVSSTVNVTVKKPVETVMVDVADVPIREEQTATVKCTVMPLDASDKTVTWQSSDTAIATVDNDGVITGVSAGTCIVTASADGKSAVVNVTVKPKGPDFQTIYDEYCDSMWATLGADGSYLSIDTNPYNSDDYTVYAAYFAIEDIHAAMGLNESLLHDMGETTWSMGKQEESYEDLGLIVTWTYHPDKGLEITYKLLY